MNKRTYYIFLFLFLLASTFSDAQLKQSPAFKVIPLGVRGGLDESNLSAYLVAAGGTNDYICLDAGTLHHGIEKAIASHLFTGSVDEVLKHHIKGYCISHGHLDHLSGLILNSPSDSSKYIYALPSVIKVLQEKYFTWQGWANFTNEGDKPALGKYKYVYLEAGKDTILHHTGLRVIPFSLSHGNPYESTAFLISNQDNYLLYLGDTGADEIEQSDKLKKLWMAVAPLLKNHRLKAIFIEVSFPNEVPDKALFGHLTPRLLMKEMEVLNTLSEGNLLHTNIYITHRKPCADCEERIQQQLETENKLNLQLVYPQQGVLTELF